MKLPKQKESDIFAAFDKIAAQHGIVAEAAEVIEDKDKKKEPDLLDQAHPETVVVAPAYDAMNGVVENLKERQRIMIYIAQKTPRVIQTNTRYVKAQEDLFQEMIRLGFLLDSRKDPELAKLADNCSEQLTKKAIGPALIIGLGLAAIFGGGMLWSAKNPVPQNLKQDSEKALKEIAEATEDYPQITAQLLPFVDKIKNLDASVSDFNSKMDDVSQKIISLTSTGKPEEKVKKLTNVALSIFKGGLDNHLRTLVEKIKENIYEVMAASKNVKDVLKSARGKYEEAESSFMSTLKDAWYFLAGADTDDAIAAIEVLERSATSFMKIMQEDIAKLDSLKDQVASNETIQNLLPGNEPQIQTIEEKINKSKKDLPDWA